MRADVSRFVASGRWNLLYSPESKAEVARIRDEVRCEFAVRLAEAGFPRRLYLRWLMRRVVRREVDRLAPPGALYVGTRAFGRCAGSEFAPVDKGINPTTKR